MRAVGLSVALLVLMLGGAFATRCARSAAAPDVVVVVGAGLAGLSAAHEAAAAGASVLVIDMASVFGGHAVVSGGVLNIVDTPLQRQHRVDDSPELAFGDYTRWGEDANEQWVRYYVEHSRAEIYDWLHRLGVVFHSVGPHEGNSVARLHFPEGRGLAIASAVYRACLRQPQIRFAWNTEVLELTTTGGRITGVRARAVRTGEEREYRASAVILATGGMESALELVKAHWPEHLPEPPRVLAGAARTATGQGLDLARQAGGAVERLDHRWMYALGLPHPTADDTERGLALFVPDSVWVNADGKRFVNEAAGAKTTLGAMLQQKDATYWAVFDAEGARDLEVNLPGWTEETVREQILNRPRMVKRAASLERLAQESGLPVQALLETISRHNRMVDEGFDADFGRWNPSGGQRPDRIEHPPYYAARFYPITRKSMGGIKIDLDGQVLDVSGVPLPGLYAAGEVTGFAGINGKFALEGTFLGPCIVTGRVAGRHAATSDARGTRTRMGTEEADSPASARVTPRDAGASVTEGASCSHCHDLKAALSRSRAGYWHFEQSHRVVLEKQLPCVTCHPTMEPYAEARHRIDPLQHVETCTVCHGSGGS